MLRYIFTVFICLYHVFPAFTQNSYKIKSDTIHAICEKDFYPYEFVDKNGNPDGFDIEIFKSIMNRLNLNYDITAVSHDSISKNCKIPKSKVIINATCSPEKLHNLLFSSPYGWSNLSLISRADNPVKSIAMALTKRILIRKDRDYLFIADYGHNVSVQPDIDACLKMLDDNKGDVIACDNFVAKYYIAKYKSNTPFIVTPINFEPRPFGFAVSTYNPSLLNKINYELNTMMLDGTYKEISDKWFYQDGKSPFPHWIIYMLSIGAVIFIILIFAVQYFRIKLSKMTKEIILEKKEAERRDRAKTIYLNNMNSEIRTPLNAITGFSQVLGITDDPQERQEYLNEIERNSKLLTSIIDDIIDLSKIETGIAQLNNTEADINGLCTDIYRTMQAHRNNSPVKQELKLYPQPLIVNTDQQRVCQVIRTFTKNAVQFTQKGSITIETSLEKNMVKISVTDTGTGISPDQKKNIFERFGNTSNNLDSSGLDLSLCRAIIHMLGGEIGVDSEVGKGSSFWIKLKQEKV